jgi:ABC-type molybdate transport system substrate-binding protein
VEAAFRRPWPLCAIAITAAVTLHAQSRDELHVCHAGSLLAAFTQVEDDFKKQRPTMMITDTSGGSVDLVRRFASGRLECDVVAPADHLVIDTMLKPARLADYTIVFASGRMVLAYSTTDPKAKALTVSGTFNPPASIPAVTGTWYNALTTPGVRISGAHPFMDPGGYRAHMVLELAQTHHKVRVSTTRCCSTIRSTSLIRRRRPRRWRWGRTSTSSSPTSTTPRARRSPTPRIDTPRCRVKSICRTHMRVTKQA